MNPTHAPAPVDLASESAAGEEDPGASIDITLAPGAGPRPDSAVRDCVRCAGSGKVTGLTCPDCKGSGKATATLGQTKA
ncbi:hypothetical protein [Ramlibacter sp.]|uniref:hypothetical protein n=1 Tax=Ramlibacter sp. TaxID=1917967 RepID=UPI003D11BBD6